MTETRKIHFENVFRFNSNQTGKFSGRGNKVSFRAEERPGYSCCFIFTDYEREGLFEGVLLFPKEEEKEVDLTPELEKEIKASGRYKEVIAMPSAHHPSKIKYCTHCAYRVCWS